jgi:5'-deoxynucleotidase YfbR-like HD superfamily hydrolase
MKTTVQLTHGEYFDPFAPDPALINLDGLATALSNLCRFTGNVRHFYSVAQHAVYVSENCHPGYADLGLHHDDPEGLGLGDLPAPIKHTEDFAAFRWLEDKVMAAVVQRFSLHGDFHESVKIADRRMVLTEKRDLKVNDDQLWEYQTYQLYGFDITPFEFKIAPWPPAYAKERFLRRHEETEYLSLLTRDERDRRS